AHGQLGADRHRRFELDEGAIRLLARLCAALEREPFVEHVHGHGRNDILAHLIGYNDRVSGVGSPSRTGDRERSEREQEREQRRLAVYRAIGIGIPTWISFFVVDLISIHFIGANAGMLFFTTVRVVVTLVLVACLLGLRTQASDTRLKLAETPAFFAATLGTAINAIGYGGLNSHYVQGVSVVIMFHRACVPERFGGALAFAVGEALT